MSEPLEPFALSPVTDAGRQFVKTIITLRDGVAARAAAADREGRFVTDSIAELRQRGVYGMPAPTSLGGGGLDSFHDLAVGIFELGRACGSTAIASYMHLSASLLMARAWNALAKGDRQAQALHLGELLAGVAAGTDVIAVASSEPGTLATAYPLTEAVASADGTHYVVNGHKIFATLSPVATVLNALVRVPGADAIERRGFALIRTDSEGVEVIDDWDALGMRGSGSGQVRLSNVRVPASHVSLGGPVRSLDGVSLYQALIANTGLIAAGLGIAQQARDLVASSASRKTKAHDGLTDAERPAMQLAMGELDAELWAAKAMASRNALDVDAFYDRFSPRQAPMDDLLRISAATRATKVFVERAAVHVVDRALQLTGGAGYMSGNPLSRLYRDVRAIPFMVPQAAHSLPFVGAVAFGVSPAPG